MKASNTSLAGRQLSPRIKLASLAIIACAVQSIPAPADPPPLAIGNAVLEGAWFGPKYGDWRSCTMGGGGYILNTVVTPSDKKRVYSYGDMDGIFRSDDGGNSWRNIEGAMDTAEGNYAYEGVVVNPNNADDVVAASGECQDGTKTGIYISSDAGTTWKKTLTVRFTGSNGPYRWTGSRLAGSWGKNGLIAATSGDGVFRSEDGGLTWRDCGLRGIDFTDVYIDKTNPNNIWLCAAPADLGAEGGKLAGGLYRSGDAGKTWNKSTGSSPYKVVQDPLTPSVLYGLFSKNVKRSRDGGTTWQDYSLGLPALTDDGNQQDAAGFMAIAAGPNFIVVSNSDGKTLHRLNCGQSTWQTITPNYDLTGWRITFCKPAPYHAASIVIDPRNPNHWFISDPFGLYQTWNAGQTLSPDDRGIETTCIDTIVQDPTNSGNVYLGAADVGFWRSDDGGAIMHQTDSSAAGWVGNIKCIDLSPKMPSRVYAAGGEGWDADRLYVSTDYGKTVNLLTMHGTGLPDEKFSCNTIIVDPRDPYSVYLATSATMDTDSGGVYHSSDGGQSWKWVGQGLPIGKQVFNSQIWWGGRQLAMGPDGTLLAISNNCGAAYRYDEAAGQWVALNMPHQGALFAIAADQRIPGRFYISVQGDDLHPNSGAGGLYRTDDDGATWTKVLAGNVHGLAVDKAVENRIAVSTGGGIVLSTNAGVTWTHLQRPPNQWYYDGMAFAGNRLLVGTGGNGAFWTDLSNARRTTIE